MISSWPVCSLQHNYYGWFFFSTLAAALVVNATISMTRECPFNKVTRRHDTVNSLTSRLQVTHQEFHIWHLFVISDFTRPTWLPWTAKQILAQWWMNWTYPRRLGSGSKLRVSSPFQTWPSPLFSRQMGMHFYNRFPMKPGQNWASIQPPQMSWQQLWQGSCVDSWHNAEWWFNNFRHQQSLRRLRLRWIQWLAQYGMNWRHLDWLQKRWLKWWKLFRQIIQGNCWHQTLLHQFASSQLYITIWNLGKRSSTSHGRSGCRKSSTRRWQKLRHTKLSGQRHSCWELYGTRHPRFPWTLWDFPLNGWWKLSASFETLGSWLGQHISRYSKNMTTSSSTWQQDVILQNQCFGRWTYTSCWKQISTCGAKWWLCCSKNGRLTMLWMSSLRLGQTCLGYYSPGHVKILQKLLHLQSRRRSLQSRSLAWSNQITVTNLTNWQRSSWRKGKNDRYVRGFKRALARAKGANMHTYALSWSMASPVDINMEPMHMAPRHEHGSERTL